MPFVCVLTTAPRLSSARKLADLLIKNKLAACVTLIPSVESHYLWKGKKEQAREIQLLIKTTRTNFKRIELFFKKNHPYEVPELVCFSITQASPKYSAWMRAALAGD